MTVGSTLPLKITLLGVGARDTAMLDLFLRKHCPGGCRLVSEERADICILDLDGVHGKKLLQQQREQYPHRPLIVVSVRDIEIDGVQFLRKPIRTDSLKQAIEFYRSELMRTPSTPEVTTPSVPQPETPVAVKRAPVGFSDNDTGDTLRNIENQQRIAHEYCGLSNAIDLSKKVNGKELYYDPDTLFQRILKSAVDRCRQMDRPVRLHLPGGRHITMLPKANAALTDLSDSRLRPRCLLAINPNETRIEQLQDSESQLLKSSQHPPQNIDALLWKVALWSARGRLPIGIDIHSKIGLNHWPNLTRLVNIPQFLRVAALWAKHPRTLAGTVETLGIEARYVCAFFSACHALDLTWIQTAAASPEVVLAEAPKPARSGILGRILRRLRVA